MTERQRGPAEDALTAMRLFEDGRREFLAGRFFEAHDVWEEFWHRLHGPDRRYLQGLIHLAVGAYHFESGNLAGARSQWQKAVVKLGEYPEGHWGVDVSDWVRWIAVYLDGEPAGSIPDGLPFIADRFPRTLKIASD